MIIDLQKECEFAAYIGHFGGFVQYFGDPDDHQQECDFVDFGGFVQYFV